MKKTPMLRLGSAAKFKPLPTHTLALVYRQLAQLQKAGIPAQVAVAQLQSEDKTAQVRLRRTRQAISKGRSLAEAGVISGLWTGFDAALLQVADDGGMYEGILQQLAEIYETRERRRRELRSRLWMPLGVLLLALLLAPLPQLFADNLSLAAYWLQSFGSFAGVLMLLYGLRYLPQILGSAWHLFSLSLPIVGNLIQRRQQLEFIRALGLLMQAGVPILQALPQAQSVVTNRLLRKRLDCIQERLEAGALLSEALPCARGLVRQRLALANSGDYAGSLDSLLLHYVALEEADLQQQEENLSRLLPRVFYGLISLWMISTLFFM